jgi:iron complex outermembrane receptor protein
MLATTTLMQHDSLRRREKHMLALSRRLLPCVAMALLVGASTSTQAQDGRIAGSVRSPGGQPIAAARVTATHNVSRAARSTTTSADGQYAISGLASGPYTVSATLVGYRRSSRADVQVPTSGPVDFALEVLPLQSITVTATLREQELADIPFSIAAPTASVLRERGADNIEMIAQNVAGFSVQNLGPGQSQVAMRGASAGQIARDQPGVKESVGAYLDDAPISLSLYTPDLDLFDLSRVEVLRGPQGTLFGAGSTAGTVRYITNQPELGVNSLFGEIGANWIDGGSPGGSVKVGTNVPLGEKMAGRIALYHSRLAGWMDAVRSNLLLDQNVNKGERTGVRAALKFAPNDRFTITPRIVLQRLSTEGWNRIDTFNILANPYTTSRPAVTLGERKLYNEIKEPYDDDFILGDVNLRHDFGRANVTSITSYGYRDILVVRDGGALYASVVGGTIGLPEAVYEMDSPFYDVTKLHVFTQEARLAGGTDRARWLLGGFFSNSIRDYGQSVYVSGFTAASGIPTQGLRAAEDELFYSDLDYDLKQTAIFGEGTINVGGKLDLTAGLRYYNFSEDRQQVFDGIFGNNDNGTLLVSQPGSVSANGLAPRFIASFKATDQLTLNAQASRGFRLGGINDPLNASSTCTAADLATFGPLNRPWRDETAWNYEVGAKSQFMGGRAALNLSAFMMDIRDLQLTITAGSCSSRLIFNAPKAVSSGAEIEFTAAPNQNFDFSIAGSFNDAKLRSTFLSGTDTVSGIAEGNRLPSVPKFQASGAATFRRPLRATGSQAFLGASVQHVGSRYTLIDDLANGFGRVDMDQFAAEGGATVGGPLTQQFFDFDPLLPAYTLVNLRTGITRANWETAFFINNLADTRALLALDRERGTRARVGYLTNQPRTIGVSLGFNY